MIINGERALAYIVRVDNITEIAGADNIENAVVGGWNVIVKKQEFRDGDKAVFFEIDSKLPDTDERFKFLESKHYKIKTMKLGKFNAYSQGLLMPLSSFPELRDPEINTDVTKILGVKYSVAEDNVRKAPRDPNTKYKSMGARHPKLFRLRPVRWLMKRKWGRVFLFALFGKKKDKPLAFPDFVKKTDEERVENMPWVIGNRKPYVITEKLDGTSCTYAMRRAGRKKFEFFVCSRNVRQPDQDQKTYHDHNIYWDMAFKYDIERHLRDYLEDNQKYDWVYVQGEGVGSVQGNPLKLKEDDLYLFNFVTPDGRLGSSEGRRIAEDRWNMKWVPILDIDATRNTMEETKEYADGFSKLNPNVLREGLVYRSLDGAESFKNVSRKYLLKKKE